MPPPSNGAGPGDQMLRRSVWWWSRGGWNPCPRHCVRRALPTELRPRDGHAREAPAGVGAGQMRADIVAARASLSRFAPGDAVLGAGLGVAPWIGIARRA